MTTLKMQIARQIDEHSGKMITGSNQVMTSVLFYKVRKGSMIHLLDASYEYCYAFYTSHRPEEYLYSYAYEEEQNWSEFAFLSSYLNTDTTLLEEGYLRISIRKKNNQELLPQECNEVSHILSMEPVLKQESSTSYIQIPQVQTEIQETVDSIRGLQSESTLTFTLLTDSHMTVNGTWQDTLAAIREVEQQTDTDAIIHLGDLQDGMLPKEYCYDYAKEILQDLQNLNQPLYVTIGNHDMNYFRGNTEPLSDREAYQLYLSGITACGKRDGQLWYYEDFEKAKLRCLFLHSFDYREELRYGFSEEELVWVQEILTDTPEDYKIVIFSHDAPIARLDYWSKEIRNGEKLLTQLEAWHIEHNNRILGYIHGHTHADYIYRDRAFPIISVGCAKCEYYEGMKPEGAKAYKRYQGDVTQELWDTLVVDTERGILDFVRFGAGENRKVVCNQETINREWMNTKVWAHRGASGYAPENTLAAFQKAIDMGADGIELDVQFTKDRQLVVIHDETIDRVSDGTGKVVDYTLEQLRTYHFCNHMKQPEYQNAAIATLEEVLRLIKPTSLCINIELKTGINFYSGIEDSVLKLVKKYGMEERVIYSSFNHYSVKRVKELCPEAKTGFLYCDGILQPEQYAKENEIDAIHPSFNNMQYPGLVNRCKRNHILLHVWTVNTPQAMQDMYEMGVDAIITNYPDVALRVRDGASAEVKEEEDHSVSEPIVSRPIKKRKNMILHAAGITYGKVRKVFVKIDRAVQRAAGK